MSAGRAETGLGGLPLPQGQKRTGRKTASLRGEDEDSASHGHQEETLTAHRSLRTREGGPRAAGFSERKERGSQFLETTDHVSVRPLAAALLPDAVRVRSSSPPCTRSRSPD